jgi:arsenite methyltransferase
VNYLEEIDFSAAEVSELFDELPLWSAPFGLLLLDRVPMKSGLTILDVGAGTGFSRSNSQNAADRARR